MNNSTGKETLKLNLLENAIDSLKQGVEFLFDESGRPERLKISILLIAQSVELLLKERLRMKDENLIFKTTKNGEVKTIYFDEAIKRLKKEAGVNLSEGDKKVLEMFQKTRNNIQHYEINVSFVQTLSEIHNVLGVVSCFLEEQMSLNLRDLVSVSEFNQLLEIEVVLNQLTQAANNRIEKLRKEFQAEVVDQSGMIDFMVTSCNDCWQHYFVFSPAQGISRCELCGFEEEKVKCPQCDRLYPKNLYTLYFDPEEYTECNNCYQKQLMESIERLSQ